MVYGIIVLIASYVILEHDHNIDNEHFASVGLNTGKCAFFSKRMINVRLMRCKRMFNVSS